MKTAFGGSKEQRKGNPCNSALGVRARLRTQNVEGYAGLKAAAKNQKCGTTTNHMRMLKSIVRETWTFMLGRIRFANFLPPSTRAGKILVLPVSKKAYDPYSSSTAAMRMPGKPRQICKASLRLAATREDCDDILRVLKTRKQYWNKGQRTARCPYF